MAERPPEIACRSLHSDPACLVTCVKIVVHRQNPALAKRSKRCGQATGNPMPKRFLPRRIEQLQNERLPRSLLLGVSASAASTYHFRHKAR